jgi:hypothetical protein
MNILEQRYEEMQKEAAEEQMKIAQVDTLTKFAEAAEDMLQEQGEEYTADDVIKVASFLIDAQLEDEEITEKVAEFVDAGRLMAHGFIEGLEE